MGKILEAFFTEQLMVDEVMSERTPWQEELLKRVNESRAELEEKIDDGTKQLLEEYKDAVNNENYAYALNKFIRGYELGVLMMAEVFQDRGKFFFDRGE